MKKDRGFQIRLQFQSRRWPSSRCWLWPLLRALKEVVQKLQLVDPIVVVARLCSMESLGVPLATAAQVA